MTPPQKKTQKTQKKKNTSETPSPFANLTDFIQKPKTKKSSKKKSSKQKTEKIPTQNTPIPKKDSTESKENKKLNKKISKNKPNPTNNPEKTVKASMKQFKQVSQKSSLDSKKNPPSTETQVTVETGKEKDLIKTFYDARPLDFGDFPYQDKYPRENRESQKSYHLRILQEEHLIVQDMEEGVLLTVEYDGELNKAFAKFYDLSTKSIKTWIDTTNHRPYCYHKDPQSELSQNQDLLDFGGYDGMEPVKKWDLLEDREIEVTKIYGKTPSDIGGTTGIKALLEGAWEANIRYHHNFIYDQNLIPGMVYTIQNGNILPLPSQIDPILEKKLQDVFKNEAPEIKEMATTFHPIFSSSNPPIQRMAFDIEVEEAPDGRLPDPTIARHTIISVSFAATDGLRLVYCLERNTLPDGKYPAEFPENTQVLFFKSEKNLLIETFRKIWEYPIIITFNGDNFDNTYLYNRARKLKIDDSLNPILTSRGGGMVTRNTEYKQGIHIDLFQFFSNRSIKGYAFGGAYLKNSLEEISSSLLGEGKIKHEGKLIGEMNLANLIHYNMVDSIRTLELTTFNSNLMWNLLVVLMRITRLPMCDLFRLQISAWIKSLFLAEHRRHNYIVPRMFELEERGNFDRKNSDRFQGAFVIDPIPGIHFQVAVLDFSSLYPSTIKTRNLSYETIKCIHEECETNLLPDTKYWVCTKRMGIFASVVGFLRDVRVNYFKPLSNDRTVNEKAQESANVMASALKVFINGAYGVFGSPMFDFYFRPVAEATTAIGRYSIHKTIEKSESMGVKVLYGDTDSVFLLNPNPSQIKELVKWSTDKLDLDLELEKTYQFLALSSRKKNYIGVREGGEKVDIKGLMVKKYNTPVFIRNRFKTVQKELMTITDMKTFTQKRKKIISLVRNTLRMVGKPVSEGGFKIEDYAITVVLRRKLESYTETSPQHVKAAQLLPPNEVSNLEPGSFISYVKTRTNEGVKPVSQAVIRDIDFEKYKQLVRSTFEQVLDPLGISYEEIQGIKKLESFF